MNAEEAVVVLLSSISILFFSAAILVLLQRRKPLHLSLEVFLPIFIALLFYDFIVVSNALEHSGITALFDRVEDVVEIAFTPVFLFFLNNWRKQKTLEWVTRQETWLRTVFDAIEDGLMTTDALGRVMKMNHAMERFTGWDIESAKGKAAGEVLYFFDRNGLPVKYNPFDSILRGKYNREARELLGLKSKSGKVTLVTDTTSPIRTGNDLMGIVSVFRNMGEFQALMEQVTHMQKVEALGQLAGGLAHDLNNMLGGIMGAAELLDLKLSERDREACSDLIDMLLRSSKRAADLTANLLTFSRKRKTLAVPVVVSEVLKSALDIAERTIPKMIEIERRISENSLMVMGDLSQLQSALLNLMLNARDAMPEGGKIIVSAGIECLSPSFCQESNFKIAPGEYVYFQVEDTGTGIGEEALPHIFEPFYTTKGEGKGTGLGLAAVCGAAAAHRGAVTVQSRVGIGSIFKLFLPRHHAREAALLGKTAEVPVGRGRTLLVIDDEALVRTSTRMLLTEIGYQVLEAASGEEGIEIYTKNKDVIDLVLIDMIMPAMDGKEVLARLQAVTPGIRAVMTSGYAANEVLINSATPFLKKPFTRQEIAAVIEDALKAPAHPPMADI